MLGGERRQAVVAARRERLGGDAQVVKERGRVAVAAVELIPQHALLARLQVGTHRRGFARPRRATDPHDGPFKRAVELGVKSRARVHVAQARRREFGELSDRAQGGGGAPHQFVTFI